MSSHGTYSAGGPGGPTGSAGGLLASTPCVGVCTLDSRRNFCTGCLRTTDEITAWGRYTESERQAIMADLVRRGAAGTQKSDV